MADKEKETFREVDVLSFDTSKKVKDSYVPEGYDSVDEFLEDMRKEYELDLEFDRANRENALDDKQFAAGEQWDAEVLKHRAGLPCLTINTVPQFTAQLVGDWRQNRNAVKVVPSENGDVDTASVRGDLIRAIEMKSRASRVYDDAFESAVICGDGAFRISVEYAKDDVFDQDIFVRPIDDALSVVWDRLSLDPTGRDARHCFVDDTLPVKEFKFRFGNECYSELNDMSAGKRTELRAGGWFTDDEARITEYWRMIERDRLLGLFEDGSIHVMEADKIDDITEKHGYPVRTRIAPCMYAQMHLVTGHAILGGPYEYKLNRVPIIRMSGRVINVGGRRIRYGLVRMMKDAVRLRNFWRSIAAEQLGYAPKAQWMATEAAVEGREDDLRKAHLTRDPLLIFNDEAVFGGNVQRLEPPAPQMALLNEAQVNSQDMKDITGIHDASLGIKSNETSGKAIMARQREGDTASITFYDNGDAAILEGGDVINQLISTTHDGTRIIRTVGDDEAVKFVKINDPADPTSPNLAINNYDVALTTGTSYTTRRVEAAEAMMQAIQVYPELMQIAGDLVVKAQDWPGAEDLAARLQKTIPPQFLSEEEKQQSGVQEQQPGLPPELMQQMQDAQEQLQKLSQENDALKLANKDKEEENKIAWYKAETDRIKALSDDQVDGNELELKAIAKILDIDQAEATRAHTAQQNELARQHTSQESDKALKAKPVSADTKAIP